MQTIQQLSQEIGIGIDTLRVWEKRYGFPRPERDFRGHRCYPPDQVEELRVIKKLQNLGYRPSRIFSYSPSERLALLNRQEGGNVPENSLLWQLLTELSADRLDRELREILAKLGPRRFIHEFVEPLVRVLDRGWMDGSVSIAREHIVSDRLSDLLRGLLASGERTANQPRILFLTLSGERHKLGLLMSAALFQAEGIDCLLIQEELPLHEVPQLAVDLACDAVALSFSAHYPARLAHRDLAALRERLAAEIGIIAGGQAVSKKFTLPGVILCPELRTIPALCRKEFSLQ